MCMRITFGHIVGLFVSRDLKQI